MMSMLERFDKLVVKQFGGHTLSHGQQAAHDFARILARVIEDDRLEREREAEAKIQERMAYYRTLADKH